VKKILYRLLTLLISALGGLMATRLFRYLWKLLAHEDDAPQALQRDRSWREILGAAALEGAVFGLVKSGLDRAGAKGFERATGTWPGE
jgi:hypothetical protein